MLLQCLPPTRKHLITDSTPIGMEQYQPRIINIAAMFVRDVEPCLGVEVAIVDGLQFGGVFGGGHCK